MLSIVISQFISSCKENYINRDNVTQFSTIDAVLKGVYDGFVSLDEITKKGDFGIGTYRHKSNPIRC